MHRLKEVPKRWRFKRLVSLMVDGLAAIIGAMLIAGTICLVIIDLLLPWAVIGFLVYVVVHMLNKYW